MAPKMSTRIQQIEQRLRSQLRLAHLTIQDESALHAGHEGAKSGGGHFRLQIISQDFNGLSRIQRHRLVYDALHELMVKDIHALAIEARSPAETDI
jgi:BolA protein